MSTRHDGKSKQETNIKEIRKRKKPPGRGLGESIAPSVLLMLALKIVLAFGSLPQVARSEA